jgi:uncharacterized phiE125 gp8 family phage protein
MNASLHLITPPDEDVISLSDVKVQLRVTGTDDDALIQALIDASVAQLDPAGGGWLGRALRPQTWEMRSDHFPCYYEGSGYRRNYRRTYACELPYPPLISVDSVKYYTGDGVDTTLTEGVGYRVLGLGSNGRAYIEPIYNGYWPSSVRYDAESVRIRFTCGYEDGDDIGLPTPIKQAIVLMVKEIYQMSERSLFVSAETVDGVGSRQFIVSDNAAKVMRSTSENLLAPYRVFE